MFLKIKLGHMHVENSDKKTKCTTEHELDDILNLEGFQAENSTRKWLTTMRSEILSLSSTSFSTYMARAVPSIGSIKRSLFATSSSSCAFCPGGGTCGPWALRRAEERPGAMGLGSRKTIWIWGGWSPTRGWRSLNESTPADQETWTIPSSERYKYAGTSTLLLLNHSRWSLRSVSSSEQLRGLRVTGSEMMDAYHLKVISAFRDVWRSSSFKCDTAKNLFIRYSSSNARQWIILIVSPAHGCMFF